MKSPSKSIPASILGYVILTVVLTAGAAQSLTGTNTVDSGDIVDGTVKNIDIKPSTITGSRILDDSVGAADLAANAVGNAEMADNAVGNAEMGDNAIGLVELLDNSIGNAEMRDNAIGLAEMGDNAVGNAEMVNDAIGDQEMRDNAIGAAEVTNRSLNLDDFATAEAANVSTTIAVNANDCVTTQTGGLTGAAVGDLAIVVLRSATDGTFWEGGRVTTAGQFPLRICNTTDSNIASAQSTIDVFTVRP